jgi:hypothetical protein
MKPGKGMTALFLSEDAPIEVAALEERPSLTLFHRCLRNEVPAKRLEVAELSVS